MPTRAPQTGPSAISSSGDEASLEQPIDLVAIPPADLPRVLPMVSDLLKSVIERSHGRYSLEGLVPKLLKGEWQFWMVWDGAPRAIVATDLYVDVAGNRCCMIRFCSGEDAGAWTHLLVKIELWAKAEGCKFLDMDARKGWAKHLRDYTVTHWVLQKAL